MDIKEKKSTGIINKVISIAKYTGGFFIAFFVAAIIIVSFRETTNPAEITEYEATLDKMTDDIVNIENNILTTQKEIEELENFIGENSN